MQNKTFSLRLKIRGDAMLEALVSMALVSIIGIGAAYSTSRAIVSQSRFNAQYSAITQMRQLLQTSGVSLCSTSPTIVVGTTTLTLTVTCTPLSATAVTVNGTAVDMTAALGTAEQTITVSAPSTALFGGSGTISVGN